VGAASFPKACKSEVAVPGVASRTERSEKDDLQSIDWGREAELVQEAQHLASEQNIGNGHDARNPTLACRKRCEN
jgi:hypothetical protein